MSVRSSLNLHIRTGKVPVRQWNLLLGYKVADLARHLERQMTKGMSWQNYGGLWVIDHILPAKMFGPFQASDDPQLKACWAMSNLRPLTKRKNAQKSSKRLTLL